MKNTQQSRKKQLVAILVIVIITISIIAFINYQQPTNDISVLEARAIADDIVHIQRPGAVLVSVQTVSKMGENGNYSEWDFVYLVPKANGLINDINTEMFRIWIDTNGENRIQIETGQYRGREISDFNIDSPRAYEIAMNNETVKHFITDNETRGPGYGIFNDGVNATCCWFSWNYYVPEDEIPQEYDYDDYFDEPRVSLSIWIDVNTGEVMDLFYHNPIDEYD